MAEVLGGLAGTVQGKLTGIVNQGQSFIDKWFPPERRAELWAKFQKFMAEKPMLAVRKSFSPIRLRYLKELTLSSVLLTVPYSNIWHTTRSLLHHDFDSWCLLYSGRIVGRSTGSTSLHRFVRWGSPHHHATNTLLHDSRCIIYLAVGPWYLLHPKVLQPEGHTGSTYGHEIGFAGRQGRERE